MIPEELHFLLKGVVGVKFKVSSDDKVASNSNDERKTESANYLFHL